MALYHGSCHCGYVSYTVKLDFANPTPAMTGAGATRCNCTICHKSGYLLADPGDDGDFTLLSPAEGESALSDYTYGTHNVHHPFCPKCGIRCFIRGMFVYEGKPIHFMRVNVLTIEGKVDGTPMDDLRDIKVKYWDGKTENWDKGLGEEPWEGGVR